MAMTDWTALLQKYKICFEHKNFLNSAVQKSDRHAVGDIYTNALSLKTFELSIIYRPRNI